MFKEEIESCVLTLTLSGYEYELLSSSLLQVQSKLPKSALLKWRFTLACIHFRKEKPSLQHLFDWLMEIVEESSVLQGFEAIGKPRFGKAPRKGTGRSLEEDRRLLTQSWIAVFPFQNISVRACPTLSRSWNAPRELESWNGQISWTQIVLALTVHCADTEVEIVTAHPVQCQVARPGIIDSFKVHRILTPQSEVVSVPRNITCP